MTRRTNKHTIASLVLFAGALSAAGARAEEIHVMNSGAFTVTYKAVSPAFEKQSGNTLVTVYGPSMGATPEAIPNRLLRGEPADVLILSRSALDALVKQGKVVQGSEADLARSRIGLVVKAGAPKPDISSVEGLKRTLLRAKSIACSDSMSGEYVSKELYQRLGIEAQVAPKSKRIPATPVAEIVARGEAEVGFQQMSELLPVKGIQVVGPIPEEVQRITMFAAGITTNAKSPAAAKRLIEYLASREVLPAILKSGLEPAASAKSAGR